MSLEIDLGIAMMIITVTSLLGVMIYTVIALNKGSKPNDEQ